MSAKIEVVRRLFEAVERRDLQALLDCYHPEVQIVEPASLPYGGTYRGHDGARRHVAAFLTCWGPLQSPTEYPLGAQFCDGPGDTVVALFRHRARDPRTDERLDEPELSVYAVRGGKVVRSQMFHADVGAVTEFLRRSHASLAG